MATIPIVNTSKEQIMSNLANAGYKTDTTGKITNFANPVVPQTIASTNPVANQSTTTLSTANAQAKVPGIQNQITENNKTGITTKEYSAGNPVTTTADGAVYTPPEEPKTP